MRKRTIKTEIVTKDQLEKEMLFDCDRKDLLCNY